MIRELAEKIGYTEQGLFAAVRAVHHDEWAVHGEGPFFEDHVLLSTEREVHTVDTGKAWLESAPDRKVVVLIIGPTERVMPAVEAARHMLLSAGPEGGRE